MRPFQLHLVYPTTRVYRRYRWKNLVPPYNLLLLGAGCPPEVQPHLSDGYLGPIDLDRPADLVALTTLTATAPMSYRLADAFRSRGTPVVIGGIHPSALPEEALQHADAVVVGEAEGGAWDQVLSDAMHGRLSGVYRSPQRPDLATLREPAWHLLDRRRYFAKHLIETSRGCPFNCAFCTDSVVFGTRYRYRPVSQVVEGLEPARGKLVVFVDDNVVGQHQRARELFEALIPLNIRWIGQATITCAEDDELLELMARSGCVGFLTGLESMNHETLRKVGKGAYRPDRMQGWVRKIQEHGMVVQGEFIFGFDEDGPEVFRETVDFAHHLGLSSARFAILKPYPGTRLFAQLDREGRLLTRDWARYHTENVVFRPARMSPAQLAAGRDWAYRECARLSSILRRISLGRRNAWVAVAVNLANSGFRNTRDRRPPPPRDGPRVTQMIVE